MNCVVLLKSFPTCYIVFLSKIKNRATRFISFNSDYVYAAVAYLAPFDKPTIFLFVPHKIISFQRQQLDGNGIFAKNKLIMLMDGYVRELYAGHEY